MNKRKTRTKPAVGYIRMSTDKQEESPAQQKVEVLKLADKHGFHIIRWYQDDAISGAETHKRKGFCQMIEDATERGVREHCICISATVVAEQAVSASFMPPGRRRFTMHERMHPELSNA